MRVVFIIPSLALGGAERHLVRLVKAVKEYMKSVDIVVLSDADDAVLSEVPHGTGIYILRSTTSASPFLWLRVSRLLMKLEPEVTVGWSTYANLVAIVATRFSSSRKVVLTELNYVPKICARSRTGRLRRYAVLSLIKSIYGIADVIAANSADNVRFLSKFIGRGPTYSYLPNPIDVSMANHLATMKPEIRPADVEGPHILAIGRLQPQKGFDVLLKALALVRRKLAWRLLLVGDGPEKERLHHLARSLDIEHAVDWVGAVTNPFPYYLWADLVVLPSRFEGFPNVALEAMSCSRTVICADCKTGPKELTRNGKYGVLVRPEDPEMLAAAIVNWGQKADERNRLGALAQEHIRATYDIGQVKKLCAHTLCLSD